MFSLRLEVVSRFVGGMLLIGIGICVSLFVLTIAGGAIPSGSYETNPNFMNDSASVYTISVDSNVQPSLSLVPDLPRVSHQTAVIYSAEWRTAPIKAWSLLAGAVIVFIGILYLLLRRVHFGMSKEIFP
jgi:hypothetical protein